MKAIKPILPSLREKKRYIAYQVLSDKKMKKMDVEKSILENANKFLGELEMSKAGLIFLDWNNNKGIFRINNKKVDGLKATLALIEKVKKEPVIVRSLGVSGILNKARKRYMEA